MGKNCNLIQAFEAGIERKSTVLKLGDRTYLLSRNGKSLQSLDYITIYYLNSQNQFVFANIIDGSKFADPILSITDYQVDKNNQIIVADSRIPRLIMYSYNLANEVTVKTVFNLPSKPLSLTYNKDQHTILVATRTEITEYKADTMAIVNVYEVDQGDSIITKVLVSEKLLIYTTKNNNLFIYERYEKKINYLLDRVKLPTVASLVLSN